MSLKLTQKEFESRGNKAHKNKYDYQKSIYVNSKTKIIIICPKHGYFEQVSGEHLLGKGCKKCANELVSKRSRKTSEKFILQSNVLHNFKYNYDKIVYVESFTKVIITCPKHGDFEQTPNDHLHGGCLKCSYEKRYDNVRKTLEEFSNESNLVHSKKYSYDNFLYVNSDTKGLITCSKHGDFEQTPYAHLCGQGCPRCGVELTVSKKTGLNYDEYIKKLPEYKKYHNRVLSITKRQPIHTLLNYDKRGTSDKIKSYHLDHMFSICEGFRNNVSPEIIGNIYNLKFIPWRENQLKGKKCSITLEKLTQLINSNNIRD